MNVFDQAARYGVQRDPIGFFRWLAPGLDPSLRFHGWLDTRTLPFPREHDRICDTVADLADPAAPGVRWAVVTEFQTEPESDMLDRLLEYLARLRRDLRHGAGRREKYQVVAALVGLTGPPQPDTLEMALPGAASGRLSLLAVQRTLREEDAAATLADIASGRTSRGLLPWISLMRGGGEPDIIEEWKRQVGPDPDARWRSDSGALVQIFAELTNCKAQWQAALEGWNVRESILVQEWKAEGRAEGETGNQRANLVRILELKFKPPVPPDLIQAIETQADLTILSNWFDQAVLAPSLDDFRAAIAR